jgi:putative solute:sodium symporter small subunit
LLHRWLDQWQVPGSGFPLGFWFAQQGSILVFIGLVFFYARRMNALDAEFGVQEE